MTASLADHAIEMLIDLAERGEINPWDVQVIDVIDRFLSQLQPEPVAVASAGTGRSPYEANLSESGQAFLYASMLVLLKADTLARSEVEEEVEFEEGDYFPMEELRALPTNLERQLRRRAVAQPLSNRRVTLEELINQLQVMAETIDQPQSRRLRVHRPRPQAKSQAAKVISQLAHQENLTETAEALDQFLATYWGVLSQGERWISFEQLLVQWVNPKAYGIVDFERPPDAHHQGHSHSNSNSTASLIPTQGDYVGVFWALLLLASQSKVELEQTEFYQDLRVRSLAHDAEEATEGAVEAIAPAS
jgi:segregation and condensation protein A